MYKAYITQLKNVRKHPNADRLQLGECFGNTVCIDFNYKEDDIGVYFPEAGQLSVEFCEQNNLVRKKDENGNNIGGYLDPDKRNIKTINLRGEKSDGLFLPLNCFEYTGVDIDSFKVGDIVTVVNGHEICTKYIPKGAIKRGGTGQKGNRTRKKKIPIAPLFNEHADTEQLAYNLDAFKAGDQIEISLKIHGTSGRTGYLPMLKGYKRTIWDKIFRREGTPIYDWGYVTGSRRVVIDSADGGFYGSNKFREIHSKKFEGKLLKGETIYYEIAGYVDENTPIMPSANNKKVNDKEFVKKYGNTTVFSYGCEPGESEVYVYRMTMTNEDGDVVEYTPDYMRYRCEQMGIKCVPVLYKGYLHDLATWTPSEQAINLAETYYDGPDLIGKTHIREGVVVRIINRPKFTAYKHKNANFKILSGIAVAAVEENGTAATADMLEEM